MDSNTRVLSYELGPNGEEGATRWQTIATTGHWDGHWQGSFSVTGDTLTQIERNFNALKVEVPVDYNHSTVWSDRSPASGWISQMERRGDELSARITWTQKAAEHIAAREYRYLSPVISFSTRDRKTGKDLGASVQSVALTNTPFLEELPEVALQSYPWLQNNLEEHMTKQQVSKLALSLGLSEAATPEDIAEHAVQLQGRVNAFADLLGAEDPLSAARQLQADCTEAQEGLRAARAELSQLRADRLVAEAEAERKVTAQNRQWVRDLALRSQDEFIAWRNSAPTIVPLAKPRPAQDPAISEEITEDGVKALCAHPEVRREADGAQCKVETYVRANYNELRSLYGLGG